MSYDQHDPEDERDWLAAASTATPFETFGLDELNSLPDPEWVVEGILPMDSFGSVVGPPKMHKSFLVLDLMLCTAAGIAFNGRAVKQGRTVYSAGEGLRGLKWRIAAWLEAHPEADYETVKANFRVIPRPVRVLQQEDAARFVATCRQAGETLRIAALDTWARSMLGGDENSAQDAGRAIAVCEQVRMDTGACVAVVHHSNADGTKARGSTALLGAVEFQINVVHDEFERVKVTCAAMKDARPFDPMLFTADEVDKSVVLTELNEHILSAVGQKPAAYTGGPAPVMAGGFGGGAANPFGNWMGQ